MCNVTSSSRGNFKNRAPRVNVASPLSQLSPNEVTVSDHRQPTPPRTSVLVVEDAPELQAIIATALTSDGFAVTALSDGVSAVSFMRESPASIVVLDIGLPGINGLEVCRQIRTFSDAYIVMLTARSDETDKLVGLSVGADDYMTKPFSPREIVARVKAILRRTAVPQHSPTTPPVIAVGNVEVDLGRREARVDGTPVALATREFDLLAYLAANQGLALSRRQLLDGVWGDGWIGDDRTVDVHVRQLRKKLGDGFPLDTVWGVGYRLG